MAASFLAMSCAMAAGGYNIRSFWSVDDLEIGDTKGSFLGFGETRPTKTHTVSARSPWTRIALSATTSRGNSLWINILCVSWVDIGI